MISWLRRRFSRPATQTGEPSLPGALWLDTLTNYPFLGSLNVGARTRLRELSAAFLGEKEFHGANGLTVTDRMALAVAAQACLPLVYLAPIGKPEDMFDDPQLADGGLEAVTLDTGEHTHLPTIPLQMDGKRPGAPVTLPKAGADSRAVLESLGYTSDKIDELLMKGAVSAA